MRIITIAIIVIVSQGCATMFNRTAQRRVLVTSTPPGAEVFIDGDPVGTTPTSVVVRDSAAEIRLESDGQSRQVRLSRRMSPWVWADLPAGALTGLLGAVAFRCDECDLNYVAGVFTSMAPLIVDLVTGRAMSLPIHHQHHPRAGQLSEAGRAAPTSHPRRSARQPIDAALHEPHVLRLSLS